MEKIINYTLTSDGVGGADPICGGIQGEHRATALVFIPDETVTEQISRAQEDGFEIACKTDLVTADGRWFFGTEREVSLISEPFYLTSEMTCSGLEAVVILRLIFKGHEGERKELYKAQARLYFEASPLPYCGITSGNEQKTAALKQKAEEIFKALDQKTAWAEELINDKAQRIAQDATASAKQLKKVIELAEQTEKTSLVLKQGTDFVFVGGDASGLASVVLTVDDELSEESVHPVKNKAITAAINNVSKDLNALGVQMTQQLKETAAALLLSAHPIGSLYWSADATEPSELFGGSWERVKDKFVLAAGDSYSAGSSGGEAKHTLTTQELPTHTHAVIKAFGTTAFDASNQPDWAIKLKLDAVENVKENPTIGSSGGIGYTGSNVAHNNMPPYEVYYCWKRTA